MAYWRRNETTLGMILKNIKKAELLIFFSHIQLSKAKLWPLIDLRDAVKNCFKTLRKEGRNQERPQILDIFLFKRVLGSNQPELILRSLHLRIQLYSSSVNINIHT